MLYIGIDLGGTKIAAGAVNEDGRIIAQAETPTLPARPYQDVIKDMASCVNDVLAKANRSLSDIRSIGIGIPGVADQKTGVVIFCTNLAWHNIPLREELQKYIDKPVYIDNDATVAGWAENRIGISKGCDSCVFLTLGTGLGAGVVINGKIWSGAHGVGTELGHMTLELDGIPCSCGNDGCAERYVSATALIRMARESCLEHPDCRIMQSCGRDIERINAKMIIDAAREGDDAAVRIFRRYTKYLAIVVNNITAFLDPEMIVLGGGVSRAGSFLLNHVREQLPRYLMYKALPSPRLELAVLGNEAGIIGAAMLGETN